MIVPVILSGGSGTRLWPYSTDSMPKQFLDLGQGVSLFQQTLDRIRPFESPIIVTAEKFLGIAASSVARAGLSNSVLICEPFSRGTAPAIALAAQYLKGKGCKMLVLPSDQMMSVSELYSAIKRAESIPNARHCLFGVKPEKPETGYGYIEVEGDTVLGFEEKPDLPNAEIFVASGRHYWNSGVILTTPEYLLEDLETTVPGVVSATKLAMANVSGRTIFPGIEYSASPNISIDRALNERLPWQFSFVLLGGEWSDMGTWKNLWEVAEKDAWGNAVYGEGLGMDCRDNYIMNKESARVITYGVSNLVIVVNGSTILVADRDKTADIKRLIEWLAQ